MMQTIWQPESLVAKELAALKPYLATNVKIDNAAINDRVHDLLAAGGKFLRPGFFYLFSQFGPDHNTARLQLAQRLWNYYTWQHWFTMM